DALSGGLPLLPLGKNGTGSRHISQLTPAGFVQNHIVEKIFVRHKKNLEISIDCFKKVDYTRTRDEAVHPSRTAQDPTYRRFLLCTVASTISPPVRPPCRKRCWRRSGMR